MGVFVNFLIMPPTPINSVVKKDNIINKKLRYFIEFCGLWIMSHQTL